MNNPKRGHCWCGRRKQCRSCVYKTHEIQHTWISDCSFGLSHCTYEVAFVTTVVFGLVIGGMFCSKALTKVVLLGIIFYCVFKCTRNHWILKVLLCKEHDRSNCPHLWGNSIHIRWNFMLGDLCMLISQLWPSAHPFHGISMRAH